METIRFSIRDGEIENAGSWVYAWVSVESGEVVYVGATGIPPAARTWLHLHHDDPAVARVVHRYPAAATEPLRVIACSVPASLDRRAAKGELIRQLHGQRLLGPAYVGDDPAPGEVSVQLHDHVSGIVAEVLAVIA